ncbi:phosphoethanolamine transferase [Vibrio mangrovi]|uniref:Phosphoethanolamine transferase EptA n=1 Tax=Vibrio mangrovi TaxID=474394 RepID=A0A1Y6IVH1_9VIBR|nr:phosphoethanolamine--lipid A transferase [Vibrio mangrovi]MDW6004903.1 phosphoethanolamine--lipid A transferase [Vibrio mangrovi]SMS01665.1 Phosphoethanolamine transferase EptA [Vibrio mangrovi]
MKINRTMSFYPFSYTVITLILSAYFALFLNLPIYSALKTIFSKLEAVDTGFVISIPIFFFCAFNVIFSLFTWPKITKVFFSVLIIVSSIVCYASYNYGVIFDIDMIRNIVETNTGEATSYLSMNSVLWIVILGIIPTISLWLSPIRPEPKPIRFIGKKLLTIVLSLLGIIVIAMFYYQDYASVGRNNSYLRKLIIPTYYVHSINRFVKENYLTAPINYKQIGQDAYQPVSEATNGKPTLFVFVLGETARSQNYQLNGYPRETNPYTSQSDVIAFQNVSSCGTATAVSVPCMFSRLNKSDYDERVAINQDNVLDILNRAGVDILWRENDGADKHVPARLREEILSRSDTNSLCNGTSCLDMKLLEDFQGKVASMKGNRMIVLHLMGSHGPTYYQRYPKDMAVFQPDCPRADIENCTHEQLVNSYDNTIHYTDYVVGQAIDQLKSLEDKYNTALIYMSDHGESLGEDGVYLHGLPYSLAPKYQTHVPLLLWMSPGFRQAKSVDESCLKTEAQQAQISHDYLFDTLLGAMDVTTSAYRPNQDVFAKCRQSNPALAIAQASVK